MNFCNPSNNVKVNESYSNSLNNVYNKYIEIKEESNKNEIEFVTLRFTFKDLHSEFTNKYNTVINELTYIVEKIQQLLCLRFIMNLLEAKKILIFLKVHQANHLAQYLNMFFIMKIF